MNGTQLCVIRSVILLFSLSIRKTTDLFIKIRKQHHRVQSTYRPQKPQNTITPKQHYGAAEFYDIDS